MRKILSYSHPSFSLENVMGSSNSKTIKSCRLLDLAYQLTAMTIVALFSFSVHATCTPTPDCASIGYTETSCETISLKCPFDKTKLYCFPCDSAYQYTCSNPNEYGDGESCGNKYKSCCNTDCVVGAIYYSDKTCSSCLDSNKTPIGVVVKDNELISSIDFVRMINYPDSVDILSLPNLSTKESAKNDLNGKSNTLNIVSYYGENSSTSNNAGVYCYNYTPNNMDNTKNQWYLPSAGELYENMYGQKNNYRKIKNTWNKLGIAPYSYWFWSSSEDGTLAWEVYIVSGIVDWDSKTLYNAVTCFLPI